MLSRLKYTEQNMPALLADSLRKSADATVAYAKAQAPWTDRTGAARRGLWSEISVGNRGVILTVGHGVEYGKYLEAKGYGILYPAMRYLSRRVGQDAKIFR